MNPSPHAFGTDLAREPRMYLFNSTATHHLMGV